jgi:FAD/FMN-containing dehydrogenase
VSLHAKALRLLGPGQVLTGAAIGPRYTQDLWGVDVKAEPRLVLCPDDTAQVAAVLRACRETGTPVVVQGGMTGLTGAGLPGAAEAVLSLERMNRIEELDEVAQTMTVQAGVTLAQVQDRAAASGLEFPLDLTSRGSCTIGGCLATNAGGNRVLRHGPARDLVLGVEAVLADGTVVSGLRKLVKNNTGYDLKNLFIGSEGTLGVITRAVLRLRPLASSRQAAFLGVGGVEDALALLNRLRASLPGSVAVFEGIWRSAYELVHDEGAASPLPLPPGHPVYVLVQCEGSEGDAGTGRFLAALEDCGDLVADGFIATTRADIAKIWAVREEIPMRVLRLRPLIGFDVSLPAAGLGAFLGETTAELTAAWPGMRLITFGHLGDGNLHLAVVTGTGHPHDDKPRVEEIVYRAVGRHGGSISGEHGIGFEKRAYLHYSRTPEEIALMRTIKAALDPGNILAPGRIFPAGP